MGVDCLWYHVRNMEEAGLRLLQRNTAQPGTVMLAFFQRPQWTNAEEGFENLKRGAGGWKEKMEVV